MRTAWTSAMLLLTGPALAQGAGPPVPVAAKTTPAEQAIEHVRKHDAPRPVPAPCRVGSGDAITVCGVTEGQRARAPLDDQGIRDGARTATGELPSTAAIRYTNPVGQMPRTGATLTVARGKASVKGNRQ